MSNFTEFDDIRADVFTTSAITATGATTLVAAFGTNQAILVDQLRVVSLTSTTALVEVSFGDTTTVGHFYAAGAAIGTMLDINFPTPWRLATNSALIFAATVGAASTPTLRVTAKVRNLRLGAA